MYPGPRVRSCREMLDRIERLITRFEQEHARTHAPKPRISAPMSPAEVRVDPNGEFDLPIRVTLSQDQSPATAVEVLIRTGDDIDVVGAVEAIPQLSAGQASTVHVRGVLVDSKAADPTTTRVKAQLRHRSPDGKTTTTPFQSLSYLLLPHVGYRPLKNPFRAYAGGTTVADPDMFFGRDRILDDLCEELSSGPIGQGFALYGQKRSGKSSLLEQLRLRVDESPIIALSVSVGQLDKDNLVASFVAALLEDLRQRLFDALEQLPREWSTQSTLAF